MSDRPTLDENLAFRRSFYAQYGAWKDWAPFTYGPDEAETFSGELGLRDLTGKTLLEIGFGPGNLLAWARDRGAEVVGVEVTAESLEAAAARGIETFPAGLGAAVEANRDRFDFIVAFDVFEHLGLPEILDHLRHCAALLKPDGLLLLRFPNAQSPFGSFPQYGDVTHITPLSGDQIGQLAQATPLELISVRAAHRPRGSGIRGPIVRWLRYRLQDLVQLFVRFAFVQTAPIAAVVTVILKRKS